MSYNLAPIPLTVGVTSPITIPGDLGAVTWVKITNASPYLVQLTNILSGQDYLQPGEANVWPVPGLTTAIQATPIQFATAPSLVPVSSLVVTWYQTGEQPSGNYPVNFNLLSYTGNTLVSAAEVINDGYALGTNVVEATPQGATASYILIRNDGTMDVQAISNGVLTDILHLTPGTSGTPAQLVLQLLKTLGALALDSGAITTDGAGKISTLSAGFPNWQGQMLAETGLSLNAINTNTGSYVNLFVRVSDVNTPGTLYPQIIISNTVVTDNNVPLVIHAHDSVNVASIDIGCQMDLRTTHQETGACGFDWVASGANDARGYMVNFRLHMTNIPTSITLTVSSSGNVKAGTPTATNITRDGFLFFIEAAAAGSCNWIGTYTTVGN